MSQNDFNIANQTFPNTRVDLNGAFQALASMSGGASEPSTTYAGQTWHDTTNDLMKIRNKANSAWITVAKFDTANDRWEIRSNIIQASSAAGITFKNSSGSTILTISDTGDIAVAGTVDGVDIAAEEARLQNTSGTNTGDQTLIEVFQSKQTLSADSLIDFALVSGVDEHIFTLRSVRPDVGGSHMNVAVSDDGKSTFEDIHYEIIHDLGQTTTTFATMNIGSNIRADRGSSGKLVISQLGGEFAALKSDIVTYNSTDTAPRLQTSNGYAKTVTELTDIRFTVSNSGSDLLNSGEIIYSTRIYA